MQEICEGASCTSLPTALLSTKKEKKEALAQFTVLHFFLVCARGAARFISVSVRFVSAALGGCGGGGGDGSRSTDGNGEPNFGVHALSELVKAQGAFEIARKHMCFLFCFAVFPTISRI